MIQGLFFFKFYFYYLTLIKCLQIVIYQKVKLATIVAGDQKAPFSIATTPMCRAGFYSPFP